MHSSQASVILVVEDDPNVRTAVCGLLESFGYSVRVAGDGREALLELEHGTPDLILSDIRMPHMDGFGLLKAVRESPAWFNIPFVIVSGQGDSADRRMGMRLGADDYVTKPYEPSDLEAAIGVRLDRSRKLRATEVRHQDFLLKTLPHELRTPLTGIMGYSELLVAAADEGGTLTNAELREYGEGIKISGERLFKIVKSFLLWAEIEAARFRGSGGAYTMQQEQVSRSDLVSICRIIGTSYGRPSDAVVKDFEGVTVAVAVRGVSAVVGALIENAYKHSLPGQPVEVSCLITASTATLIIRDHGRGMSREQIARLGLFRQFDRARHEQQGLGLGLAVAASFAEVSKGQLELFPEERGLSARLTLPRFTEATTAASVLRPQGNIPPV